MSDKSARANRYAQATFQAMLDRWQAALSQVSDRLSQDQALAAELNDASKSTADKLAALEGALPTDTPAEVSNLLKLLVQAGDLNLLSEVSTSLTQLVSGNAAPIKAEITSAVELSDEEKQKLQQVLSAEHGEGVTFSFSVNPALMGGLRVRVGDRLIDTSVASRLSALRESLTAAVR